MPEKSSVRKVVDAAVAFTLVFVGSIAVTWGALSFFRPDSSPFELKVEFTADVTEEPNDFVADVRAAAQLARELWSYREQRAQSGEVDLAALEQEALELLGETPDAASFRQAIRRFAAGLHDGHAGVRWTAELQASSTRWPLSPALVMEGVAVDGLVASAEGVSRGDLILEVDGRPIEAWLAEAERFVCASTPGARRVAALQALSQDGQAPYHEFKLQRLDGSIVERALPSLAGIDSVPAPSRVPITREARRLPGDLGYFRPGTFAAPANSNWAAAKPSEREGLLAATFEEFDAQLEQLSSARGIVLDLRGNPGGTDILGQFLTDRLLEDSDYTYYRLASQGRRGWGKFNPQGSDVPSGRTELRQPLAVLIDDGTFSTADNVAFCLADHHPNVAFIGRPNGAGSGAPRGFALPRTGVRLFFSTMRVHRSSGSPIEGHPLTPDVPVTWTRSDLLEGRDPDLAAATQWFDAN